MPTYEYRCEACSHEFEMFLRMSDCDTIQSCPSCKSPDTRKLISGGAGFILSGDDWTGKNIRVNRQMEQKNRSRASRQEERKRDAPVVQLAPNVGGERTESWADAQRLAAAKGKDAASYTPMVQKEKASK